MKKVLYLLLVFVLFACSPKTAYEHYLEGFEKQRRGDRIGAIEDYTKAIELNSLYKEAYINRGWIKQMELFDLRGAESDYTRAIQIATCDPHLWDGKWCRKDYENYFRAYNYRAQMQKVNLFQFDRSRSGKDKDNISRNRDTEEFVRIYEEYEKINGEFITSNFSMAFHNPEETINNYIEAITYIGRYKYWRVGLNNKACAYWKKAANLGSTEAAKLVADNCN